MTEHYLNSLVWVDHLSWGEKKSVVRLDSIKMVLGAKSLKFPGCSLLFFHRWCMALFYFSYTVCVLGSLDLLKWFSYRRLVSAYGILWIAWSISIFHLLNQSPPQKKTVPYFSISLLLNSLLFCVNVTRFYTQLKKVPVLIFIFENFELWLYVIFEWKWNFQGPQIARMGDLEHRKRWLISILLCLLWLLMPGESKKVTHT